MKKNLIRVLAIILVISAFSISYSCKAESKTEKSQKDYSITLLISNEIILVEATNQSLVGGGVNTNPTAPLTNAVIEVGQDYIIKNAVPITEKYYDGSRTVALLLFVEPKKK